MASPSPPDPSPQLLSQLWTTLNSSNLLRYILLFGCGWSTVILINYFYSTIAIFTVAAIFAVLLNYPVSWLSRYLSRGFAIAIVFTGAIAFLIGAIALLGLEIVNQGQGLLNHLADGLKDPNFQPFQEFLNKIDINRLIETLKSGLTSGLGILQGVFSSIFIGIFGSVICLYMLIDGDKLWQSCLKVIPVNHRDRFAKTFRQSFLGFLRGQMLLMLFLSSTSLLSFSWLGVNYSLFLASILGIIDAIPGIGATIGVFTVVLLVLVSQGFEIALKVLIVCLIIQQIQDNIVRPKVMGDALELNPVLLFLSLFIGERIAGILGIFLSIPIAGTIAAWMRSTSQEEIQNHEATPEDVTK
jgi:predicted PurR-regulated permease PerM